MIEDALTIVIPYWMNQKRCTDLVHELLRQKTKYPQTVILVVDDGSPDGAFLDGIDGIKVIHAPHGCPQSARNIGLDNVDTEFVTLCDCDDMVLPKYLKTIYSAMRRGYRYISFGWVFNNGMPMRSYTPGYRSNACWAYAYRTEIVGKERFDPSIKNGADDIDFVKRVIDHRMDHADLPDVIYEYYWYGNTNSLMHRILRGENAF